MNDMADRSGNPAPSRGVLLQATVIAAAIAGIVLVFIVLPAEYGIDPTGVGGRLGLTVMSSATDEETAGELPPAAAESSASDATPVSVLDALWKRDTPFRSGEMSLTLQPNEGAEIKALMNASDRMMFSWEADGPVSFDMHGEELNAGKDEFTSYWKGRNETSGHGAFVAPFAGTHGWYWRNRGNAPVTVRVRASGYYEKLFKPG